MFTVYGSGLTSRAAEGRVWAPLHGGLGLRRPFVSDGVPHPSASGLGETFRLPRHELVLVPRRVARGGTAAALFAAGLRAREGVAVVEVAQEEVVR